MSWHQNCTWWHVYPLGFCDAPLQNDDAHAPVPRLRHLLNWLDYVTELGVGGLLLGPIFSSQSHGYDSDPRLGTMNDFDDLIRACKDRGLHIVLDGVFNHLGNQHPWFQRAMNEGLHGEYASFFRINWDDPWQPRADVFEGHGALVALNHDNPAVAEYVSNVMKFWLGRGIDGWRLDAAYTVKATFWSHVIPTVRAEFPESWFVGEVIHGDYTGIVARSGIDSVTQYELWKAIWSGLWDRNFFELGWSLRRHNDFLNDFTPLTFIGNHDVTRIASLVGPEHAVLALTILLTVGGHPSIYYGDEQGFVGIKEHRFGGDDAIRPAFPKSPADLAPWGAWLFRVHQQLIALRNDRPWLTTAQTEQIVLTNEHLVYRTYSTTSDDSITVELDLRNSATASIRDGYGQELFEYVAASILAGD